MHDYSEAVREARCLTCSQTPRAPRNSSALRQKSDNQLLVIDPGQIMQQAANVMMFEACTRRSGARSRTCEFLHLATFPIVSSTSVRAPHSDNLCARRTCENLR